MKSFAILIELHGTFIVDDKVFRSRFFDFKNVFSYVIARTTQYTKHPWPKICVNFNIEIIKVCSPNRVLR